MASVPSDETLKDSSSAAPPGDGYEEVRLPPPKQFRDVPLPPEPFRDPSPGPTPGPRTGPSPAIDNLLYHVYESIQDDIKKSQSNTDLTDNKLADKIEGIFTIILSENIFVIKMVHRFSSNRRNPTTKTTSR